MNPSISIIIPALNEGQVVNDTVAEVTTAVERSFVNYEIVLVDDGSTDETGAIMDRLAAGNQRIRAIHNERNLGFGGAYKRGVGAVTQEYVIMVPGDNAFSAASLDPIFAAVGTADIVIPVVMNPEARTFGRRVASKGFTTLMNVLFDLKVGYYNGPVVHRLDLLRQISITTNGFAYQAEVLVKLLKRGYSFVEVSTEVLERSAGKSKALRLRNLKTVVAAVFHLWLECRNASTSPKPARPVAGTGA